MLPSQVKQTLEKQQYRIVGSYAAVKICYWTKQSLTAGRVCYKEKWYGIQSHRCLQFAPFLGCNFRCLHCWRFHSTDRKNLGWREIPEELEEDDPAFLLKFAIQKRKELLSGFGGNPKVEKKKFEESLKPTLLTASLTGEPMLYSRIGELIEVAKKFGMITFLVTNGSLPQRLERLDPLPYQLYISLHAPDEKTFLKIARVSSKEWEKVCQTLELLPSLQTRKVLRITLIKDYNDDPKAYAKLVEKAEPDFVEVKGYEWVGESKNRLPREAMPWMSDAKNFAIQLASETNYLIKGEFEPSCAVLLTKS